MLTLEIIFLILAISGFVIAIYNDEAGATAWCAFLACCFAACIILDIAMPHGVRKLHTTNFEVSTRIETKMLNGKEISRDTVYIFTPRKK